MRGQILSVLYGILAALVCYLALVVWATCGKECDAAAVKREATQVERPRSAR